MLIWSPLKWWHWDIWALLVFSGQLRDPPKALRNNVRHETHHEEWPGLNSLWYVISFERWQINWFRNASSVRGWPVSNKKKNISKCKLILWFKYRNSWFECVWIDSPDTSRLLGTSLYPKACEKSDNIRILKTRCHHHHHIWQAQRCWDNCG